MLKVGSKAPDFSLPNDSGGEFHLHTALSEGPVILYFYPADFTPVCTRESCMYRDLHPVLEKEGVRILGISPQGVESHHKFRERHNLPFHLLADTDRTVIRMYKACGPLGIGVRRLSYTISQQGLIIDRARAMLRVGEHQALALRAGCLPKES